MQGLSTQLAPASNGGVLDSPRHRSLGKCGVADVIKDCIGPRWGSVADNGVVRRHLGAGRLAIDLTLRRVFPWLGVWEDLRPLDSSESPVQDPLDVLRLCLQSLP